MSDPEDRLLSDLADLARQRDGLDERWDRLASGTLTAEEEAELRALAESSPEAREAYEAFRPLGPEFQARVVDRIAAGLPKEERARVLPFRPSPARIGGWIAAAAAAAAVLVLVLRPPGPLPEYQIAVSGGSSEMRGEPAEDFAPGDRIEVLLRPGEEARPGRLEAQLFLLRGHDLRRLEARSIVDRGGAVKLTGSLGHDLHPGAWTLWAVAGRPGGLPDPAELRSQRGRIRREDWIAVPKDIRIRPRGP